MIDRILTLEKLAGFSQRIAQESLHDPCTARDFLWYFATPYTDPDATIRDERAALATRATADMICGGLTVYSPIAAHHPVSLEMRDQDKPNHSEWMDICFTMLDRCDGIVVSTMDGYVQSKGVQLEIKRWAHIHGMCRPLYVSPIRSNQPWVPHFAWQANKVEGL